MSELSFGDEDWLPTKENEEKIWQELPLSLIKGIKNKKIIEVGSGYGIYVYCFSKNNETFGLEIDQKRVASSQQMIKKSGRTAKILQGDARKLPFAAGSFDLVFCHGVIEHFPESQQAVEEGYRVLKENGIALYSVPAKLSSFVILKLAQQLFDKILGTNLWTCGYEKSFTSWKFKKILQDSGFKIIKFQISECSPGKRFPLIGRILKILDKPFHFLNIGGRFMYALCVKK
jgi:ubiquinone/menaquinone biosynthesis C-methylase UbiE